MSYQYTFPTGIIYTINDNLGTVLFDIAQLETISNLKSADRELLEEMLEDAYAQIIDTKMYFRRFMKEFDIEQEPLALEIMDDFHNVTEACIDAMDDECSVEQMQAALSAAYKNVMPIVPKLIEIDYKTREMKK